MADVITATGPLTSPLELVRKLIASCAAWQAMVGAANVEAASAYVHLLDIDETASPAPVPPLALVRFEDWEHTKLALATFSAMSVIEFSFEVPVVKSLDFWPVSLWPDGFWPSTFWPSVPLSRVDQSKLFTNFVGRMLAQMEALQQTDPNDGSGLTHIDLTSLKTVVQPGRVEINGELQEYFGVAFALEAGGA